MLAKVTPAQGLYRHFHNQTPPPFLSLLHPLLFQSWHTHIRCDKKKYFLLAADFGFSSSFLAQCFIITIFIFICCTFSFIPFHFISFCWLVTADCLRWPRKTITQRILCGHESIGQCPQKKLCPEICWTAKVMTFHLHFLGYFMAKGRQASATNIIACNKF